VRQIVAPERGSVVTSELVERAQRGDHEAFETLATAAYHRLYAIASRILRDGYAAEDAVQDALVHAWRDVRGLRDPGAFDAWLQRLLINACYDQTRRRRRRPVEVHSLPLEQPSSSDDVQRLVDMDELEQAFRTLSFEHRAVLVLTLYVGLTAPEVARVLRVPTGTVSSRLHYGLRAVRASLAPPAPEAGHAPEHGR
jgi:RNA polymerase sigma-70 factor (ECF subfamily)